VIKPNRKEKFARPHGLMMDGIGQETNAERCSCRNSNPCSCVSRAGVALCSGKRRNLPNAAETARTRVLNISSLPGSLEPAGIPLNDRDRIHCDQRAGVGQCAGSRWSLSRIAGYCRRDRGDRKQARAERWPP